MQFGRDKFAVQWSADGGATWHVAGEADAKPGETRFTWPVPREAQSAVMLRVRAVDLAGHATTRSITLDVGGRRQGSLLASAGSGAESTAAGGDALPPIDGAAGDTVADASSAGDAAQGDVVKADADADAADVAPITAHVGDGSPATDGTANTGDTDSDVEPDMRNVEPPALVRFVPPATDCLRGGAPVELRWELDPTLSSSAPALADATATAEFALDGGDEWKLAGEAPLGVGQVAWTPPVVSTSDCRLRLRVRGIAAADGVDATDPGELNLPATGSFTIESRPPTIACPSIPARVGARVQLPVRARPASCGTVDAVRVYLRPQGKSFWNQLGGALPLVAATSETEGASAVDGTLELDLGGLEEQEYDLYLAAIDSIGNAADAPTVSTEPFGSFELDATPPTVTPELVVLDWVGGFRGSLRVVLDAADCRPPLIVEGREGRDGEWTELTRYASLATAKEQIDFPVPLGPSELEVRVAVSDAVGNTAHAYFGPRQLMRSIELQGFPTEASLYAYGEQQIAWQLHPVAREFAADLVVRLTHQTRRTGDGWTDVTEEGGFGTDGTVDVAASRSFPWILPRGDEVEHRVVARLVLGNEIVGDATSTPFRIRSFDDPTAEPRAPILQDSLLAHDSACEKALRYREKVDAFPVGDDDADPATAAARAELDRRANDARRGFRDALTLDPKNYFASFELAFLLSEVDQEKHYNEILDLFETTAQLHPEPQLPLNELGAFHIGRSEYDRAAAALERSLVADETANAHYNLGIALLFRPQRDATRARQHFETALALADPQETGPASFYLVYCHIVANDLDTARQEYTKRREHIPVKMRPTLEAQLGE